MKIRLAAIAFCLITVLIGSVIGLGQQPTKSIPIADGTQPIAQTFKLNPEASKAMLELFQATENENARHDAAIKDITSREVLILRVAGIPRSEWDREMKPDAEGTIVFQPRPSPSPQASPKEPAKKKE